MSIDRSSIERRLKCWAKWKMDSGSSLGYPKSSAFIHLIVDCGRIERVADYNEIDAYCIDTDNIIDQLPAFQLFVIRLEYISNVREMKLKLELTGCKNKKTYYHYLNCAYDLIAQKLDIKETVMV